MSLKTQLTEDMKAAMKAGEKDRLGVIRLINAAIKQKEVDERVELDDAAVLAVLEKMVKQRKDSVSQYEAAHREDLAAVERAEIAVIDAYLPAKLGEAEILAAIEAAIADLKTAKDGTDADAIREKTNTLAQASMKLGEAMYASQQGAGDGDDATATADDGVVDAEFEEVSDTDGDDKKSA